MTSFSLLPATLAAVALELGPRAITSLRMLAAILLVTMLCGLIYVLRSMRDLKAESTRRGGTARRANHIMIFLACAVVFAAACVLLFLVAKSGAAI